MSQFLPEQFKEQETKKPTTPEQGPESYLSPEERKFWKRYTSFFEEVHPDFLSNLLDYVAVNIPQIPASQIVGFTQFLGTPIAQVFTGESTTSTTFTDLATVGPQLTSVGSGRFLFFFGCQAQTTAASGVAIMSLSTNGAAATDDDSLVAGSDAGTINATSMRAIEVVLTEPNNTITCKYRSNNGTSVSFTRRWLIGLRIGT